MAAKNASRFDCRSQHALYSQGRTLVYGGSVTREATLFSIYIGCLRITIITTGHICSCDSAGHGLPF